MAGHKLQRPLLLFGVQSSMGMRRLEQVGRGAWLLVMVVLAACGGPGNLPGATDTPEPIVPTRTVPAQLLPAATQVPATSISTPTLPPEPTPTPTAVPIQLPPEELARLGIAGPLEYALPAAEAGLPFGRFLNWQTTRDPAVPQGVDYWQMLRLSDEGISPDWETVESILAARPGSVWLVGNEPDVFWQDGISAERYAELYHQAYTFIKSQDPSAVVGAGGIAMASPLRLAYLDDVLLAYETRFGEPMPVDLWSVHAFTLREEAESWGIGIPPGSTETTGLLYEIEDHGRVDLFQQHLADFRAWLAENGYRDVPLAVTEFGILLPTDYGFPPELVADYLRQTMEFMRTAEDEATGLPSDGNRLVQSWFWYSLFDDGHYPTGDLYDPQAGALTPLGTAYRDYVQTLAEQATGQ